MLCADQAASAIMAPGRPGWQAILALDSVFIRPDKELNRPLMRRAIFTDKQLRHKIDNLLHPLIKDELKRQLLELPSRTDQAIVEVPLLFEAGWQDMFASLVCVYAPAEICLQRVMGRDGVTAAEARDAVAAQLSMVTKVELADHIIDNCGSWTATYLQLLHLQKILSITS